MAEVGERAPEFEAIDSAGRTIRLSDYAGKIVVLYFYPKDDTPGCTAEACGFRDLHAEFEAAGAVVLGVSRDSAQKHQRFATKYGLPFYLVADVDDTVCRAYGVIGERSMYGRRFLGIQRTTFVIGLDGVIRHKWPKVKVSGHADEVLQAVQALAAA